MHGRALISRVIDVPTWLIRSACPLYLDVGPLLSRSTGRVRFETITLIVCAPLFHDVVALVNLLWLGGRITALYIEVVLVRVKTLIISAAHLLLISHIRLLVGV